MHQVQANPKLLGDGTLPTCARCAIGNRECIRRSNIKEFQFIAQNPARPTRNTTHVSPQSLPTSDWSHQDTINHIQALASSTPLVALQDFEIARLFAHYIATLAPWYDLNDPQRTFGTTVPETALQTPILFKAIIAFSSCHWSRVSGSGNEIASLFHEACVSDFLQSMQRPDSTLHGTHLAATCLLRSYELISGELLPDPSHESIKVIFLRRLRSRIPPSWRLLLRRR